MSDGETSDTDALDYEALRVRFPWAGLVDDKDIPAAAKYREVMARAGTDRAAIDAMDAVRHTA